MKDAFILVHIRSNLKCIWFAEIQPNTPISLPFVYDNSMLHPLIPPAVKIYLCLCFNSGFIDHGCVEIKIRILFDIVKYGQNNEAWQSV